MTPSNQNSLEFKANPNKPKSGPREYRQKGFLHFLAQGESIIDARTLAGVTRSCYEQWHVRYEGFSEAVDRPPTQTEAASAGPPPAPTGAPAIASSAASAPGLTPEIALSQTRLARGFLTRWSGMRSALRSTLFP